MIRFVLQELIFVEVDNLICILISTSKVAVECRLVYPKIISFACAMIIDEVVTLFFFESLTNYSN